ncbi:Dehydrodolichyl diphosphate synthase 2 [Linum perenne]
MINEFRLTAKPLVESVVAKSRSLNDKIRIINSNHSADQSQGESHGALYIYTTASEDQLVAKQLESKLRNGLTPINMLSLHYLTAQKWTTAEPSSSRTEWRAWRRRRAENRVSAKASRLVGAEKKELPEGLREEMMPRHVAVIMDGNGRWAKQRGLVTGAGHEAGVRSLKEMVRLCIEWRIKVLTVFAFSTDNWIRPKVEVDFLMSLFERALKTELEDIASQGVRISVIGDSSKLSKSLTDLIHDVEDRTKNNSNLHLMVAVSYSGKYDVVQACQSIARQVKDGEIDLDQINESLIEKELETKRTEFPSPDLLIRTSGELRISNFLLWQLAYTELYFAEPLWPDFGEKEFAAALVSFQRRQRRYGSRK